MKLSSVIKLLDECEILNDGEFSSLGLAVSKNENDLLSFIENEKFIDKLSENITCLITTSELGEKLRDKYGVIISKNPRVDFFKLHNKLSEEDLYRREKFETVIGENCNVSSLAIIAENNVKIGKNVIIEEFVVIRENTVIDDNSVIRAGVIIGGEGYEFKRTEGIIMNVKHCGGVIIGKNVEIQYNSTIDKALYPWDNTVIKNYSKLDNMVHLEHGVKVGEMTLIASRSTIGGRTIVGNDVWIGLGAIISNGLNICHKAHISLGAVVTKDIRVPQKVSGNFAINHDKYINFVKSIR